MAEPTPEPILATPEAAPTAEPSLTDADTDSLSWYWLALPAGFLLFGAGAAAFYFRRKRQSVPTVAIPRVERPKVPPPPKPTQADLPLEPAAPPVPRPANTPAALAEGNDGPLSIALEARQLSISLTAATLGYRLTITNTGKTSLRDVAISGDMISAHSSVAQEDQVASADLELSECHMIERIPAGESAQVSGEFRLPFTRIRPIRKGDAALFVPLARLKAEAGTGGNGAVVQTALVGQRSARPGGGLQPFRLDLGPRIYREVTQRIFS